MMEMTGFRGLSAWLVYNKVVFALPFITENRAASRRFSLELVKALQLDNLEELREFVAGLAGRPAAGTMTQAEAITLFKEKGPAARKLALLECLTQSDLTDDESLRLLAVHRDGNGIPYGKANVGNLTTCKAADLMMETLLACSMVDVDLSLVSSAELEALGNYRVDVKAEAVDLLATAPTMSVGELLSLAIKKVLKGVTDGRRS